MKKKLSLLCAVALLLSLSLVARAEDAGWQQAYEEFLKEPVILSDPQVDDVSVENSYFVYDIDKDNVPELVVKTGTCEADYVAVVFDYREGKVMKIDEISVGHSSFYGSEQAGGLFIHQGHMGYATAWQYTEENGHLAGEIIFEEDLNIRLETDPEAEYTPMSDLIPGAYPLTLAEPYNPLPITHYDEIVSSLNGIFEVADNSTFPENNPDFFTNIISGNYTVIASGTSQFANSPGTVDFSTLLKKDVAVSWMDSDLKICSQQYADLNGDGQLECILDLSTENDGSPVRFFLSEEDGTIYVYIQNYSYDTLTPEENGCFLLTSDYYQQHYRLIFEKENCYLLMI